VQTEGPVWSCAFNAAVLEHLLAHHAAVAIRIVKLIAERLLRSGAGKMTTKSTQGNE